MREMAQHAHRRDRRRIALVLLRLLGEFFIRLLRQLPHEHLPQPITGDQAVVRTDERDGCHPRAFERELPEVLWFVDLE